MKIINFVYCIAFLLFHSLNIIAQEVDVVLIGGQSNATGQGYMRNIPSSFKIDTDVMFYYSKFLNQGNGGGVWRELCQASETMDKFGVELSLGTSLQKYFPDRKIALIKHALSGSNLYEQWNPGNRNCEKSGEEYVKWLNTVKDALAELEKKGYKPVIRAMVWQQGEADAREIAGMENSRRYGINLRNFILEVRKELEAPDMLFVYGEVMPMEAERFPGRNLVRTAQIEVSEASCSKLSVKNAFLVESDDLQMRRDDYRTPLPNDDVHLGTYGILTLGERFAKVIYDNRNTKL
ncbi:sialate O-acetylesterase [uncultured Bacteroides sp.]|uniref:sialate O-acetylesterase n=1 Tax=uncultured Bacteroides sp. TaxID=162156 RepID=UPI002634E87A|nr:sialate O-acetylesterase [uncultured Bacteroides sp.]